MAGRIEDQGEQYLAALEDDTTQDPALASLQRASVTYRIAMGPRTGQKVLHLQRTARSNRHRRVCAPTRTDSACMLR